MRSSIAIILSLLVSASCFTFAQNKPNIVLLMAEDLTMENLPIYGGVAAPAPNLEELAGHGIVFDNAYFCASTGSVSINNLLTGSYGPSLGLSGQIEPSRVKLPEGIHLFPYYLREAGYYTSCSNLDYDYVREEAAWDLVNGNLEEWKNRENQSQPFFHCLAIAGSRDGVLCPEPTTTNIDEIRKVDKVLGELLSILKEEGQLDNTFVFCLGLNGEFLPGTKAVEYRVPMAVYIPDRWMELSPLRKGSRCSAVISFNDLASTLLNLADVKIPPYMDGSSVLGKDMWSGELAERDMAVCYEDRPCGQTCDRVVRKQDYLYSRSFYPCRPDTGNEKIYAESGEKLYLLSKDSSLTENLVNNSDYGQILDFMRSLLDDKMLEDIDLGIIPEALWMDSISDIEAYKSKIRSKYADYLATANMSRESFKEVSRQLKASLKSDDEIILYWALVACNTYGQEASGMKRRISELLKNGTPLVRSQAASYLTRF